MFKTASWTRRARNAAAAFCVVLPAPAIAQDPFASNILALEDWGIFSAKVVKHVAAPDTSSGVREIPGQVTLIEQTREICAALGVQFGFRYHLTGAVPVSRLQVTIQTEHPSFAKWNGGRSTVDTMASAVYPGQSHWTGWAFRDPTKLVGGTWRFSVTNAGRLLLTQQFTVRTGCTAPVS